MVVIIFWQCFQVLGRSKYKFSLEKLISIPGLKVFPVIFQGRRVTDSQKLKHKKIKNCEQESGAVLLENSNNQT